MFRRESDMAPSVARWLERAGLQVKREFVTPWGICDFASVAFNTDRASHRLRLRQRKSLTSITRAALLLLIPDIETNRSISINRLAGMFKGAIGEESIANEIERLIADRFVVQAREGRFQKINGWMPLQDRIIAVELKLHKIDEAMKQAKANLGFAEESYVAFPMSLARRIAESSTKWAAYLDEGIGVIGVLPRRCEIIIPHTSSEQRLDPAIQLYCVDKFWRTRPPAIRGS